MINICVSVAIPFKVFVICSVDNNIRQKEIVDNKYKAEKILFLP